jgi:hypothetical protein
MRFEHEEFRPYLQSKAPDEVVGTMESQFTDPLATWVRQREGAQYVAAMYENITIGTSEGSIPYPTPRWAALFLHLLAEEYNKGTFVEWRVTAQQALDLLAKAVEKANSPDLTAAMTEEELIAALQPLYEATPERHSDGYSILRRIYTQWSGDMIIYKTGDITNLRNAVRLHRGMPLPE